jgi:uncharacterized phage protein gp47/JayE
VATIPPYNPPSFLQNQSADAIHRRMMAALPDDIDKSESSIPWDFTRPAANEKALFAEYELNETIQLIFPHWSYGEWLDKHAEMEGLYRRPPNRATGHVKVTARAMHSIAQGFLFATPANLTPSVVFEAADTVTFNGVPDAQGLVTMQVPVRAAEGGPNGNVPPGSISLMVRPDLNVVTVENEEATSGGTPEEQDDSLRLRVLDVIRSGQSFTGCDADYVRWAKEVPGVGDAVTQAEWAGPGTVRVFVIDANGLPANQQILDAVYQHIISPGNRMARKAPIGASLTVAAPSPMYVDISARVTLAQGEDLGEVTERFMALLSEYWLEATTENDLWNISTGVAQNWVKYVQVGARLANTPGVVDYGYATFTLNNATDNILIDLGSFPVTGAVNLYE